MVSLRFSAGVFSIGPPFLAGGLAGGLLAVFAEGLLVAFFADFFTLFFVCALVEEESLASVLLETIVSSTFLFLLFGPIDDIFF